MKIKRIVPDIQWEDLDASREFYAEFLELDLVMDQGWVLTFASPVNPSSQVTLIEKASTEDIHPDISIEVDDVRKSYAAAEKRKLPIVYPLTHEPWGVTRFFVRDPNGKIVNILSHTAEHEATGNTATPSDQI